MMSPVKKESSKEVEFHPDAMQRFERAVKVVAKSPPQHRVVKKAKNAAEKRPRTKKQR